MGNNKLKQNSQLFFLLFTATFAMTALSGLEDRPRIQIESSSEQTSIVNKASDQVSKITSEKKRKKALKKLKSTLSKEKQAKLLGRIGNSDLSESQKTGLMDTVVELQIDLENAPIEE